MTPVRHRVRSVLFELLLAAAVSLGLVWGVVWCDLLGGPQEAETTVRPGSTLVAGLSAGTVLTLSSLTLASWLAGRPPARVAAVATGTALLGSAPGWDRVPGVDGATAFSVLVGVALLVSALPVAWSTGPCRGPARRNRLRLVLLLPVAAVLVVGASTAWFGWTLRVVNRPEEGENGWPYLAGGVAACALALVVGDLLVRRGSRTAAGTAR